MNNLKIKKLTDNYLFSCEELQKLQYEIDSKEEIWKSVIGYENIYEISNLGRIRSIDHIVPHKDGKSRIQKGRFLHTYISEKGYIQTCLSKEGKRFNTGLHRIIAIAFIKNPNNLPQVNHKDGIKDNNSISNLEWSTNQENQLHAVKNGLVNHNYGEDHHMSKLTNKQVVIIRQDINNGKTLTSISKEYNVSITAIWNIKKGKSLSTII